MRRRFEETTSAEIAALGPLERAAAVAVLPIAATEQHGAHLPLGTDALIADGMVETLLPLLPEAWPVTILPTLRVGRSAEHGTFPGTLDLGWETATRILLDIGASLAASGFRRLAIVSSHGGNTPTMESAALELRRRFAMLVATASWQRFGVPDRLLPAEEIATGIHGGAVETALMLHFRPDLVRGEAVAAFPSLQAELEGESKRLRAHGRLGFAWMAGDLNPEGVVGNARLASATIGRVIAEHQASGFAELVGDLLAFDLERLR